MDRPDNYKTLLALIQKFGLDIKTGGVKETMLYQWYSDVVDSAYQDGWDDKAQTANTLDDEWPRGNAVGDPQ